jgi:serine/threonine-protein kinase RsbW
MPSSAYRASPPQGTHAATLLDASTGSAKARSRPMMEQQPNVRVALASRAENVVLVREIIGALGECADLGGALDEVKAAVSEACNNVVLHAYPGAEGPMEVEFWVRPGELQVLVRDHGIGTASRVEDDAAPGRGIGLAVIEALTTDSELRARRGDGVEVTMRFEVADGDGLAGSDQPPPEPPTVAASDVRLQVAPVELSGAILNHLLGTLGARAAFSIDRLSDAQLVSDALGARLAAVLDGRPVVLGVDVAPRAIVLRVGGLGPGDGAALLTNSGLGELGGVIERLADEVEVSEAQNSEVLVVTMRAQPAPSASLD